MGKKERQRKLIELVKVKRIANQQDLQEALSKLGISANQASISRDLNELGISKLDGFYSLPKLRKGDSKFVESIDIDTAGDNLFVIRTPPGKANSVAIVIDDMRISEVVGTLAGDDTIFVATKGAAEQRAAMQIILKQLRK